MWWFTPVHSSLSPFTILLFESEELGVVLIEAPVQSVKLLVDLAHPAAEEIKIGFGDGGRVGSVSTMAMGRPRRRRRVTTSQFRQQRG
jgi:hypothetical protein